MNRIASNSKLKLRRDNAARVAVEPAEAASQAFDENAALLAALDRSQAVVELGLDGRILSANPNFLRLMGYALHEVQGQHHSMFVEESFRNAQAYREFWERLNRGEYVSAEFKRIAKGGREVWIEGSYNPVLDATGRPMKVVKYATDITAKKLTSVDHAGQVQAIGRALAVIEFRMDGTIIEANANFLATLGYGLEEIRGKHHSMFVEETERSSQEYRDFWARLNRGEFVAAAFKRIGKGGKEVWIQASYNPIFDADGRPWKVIKYATDITKQTRARLVAENIAQTTLASSASELASVSQQMTSAASETSIKAESVSAAAEEVSANLQTVAASTEEMTATIRQIASSAADAARVASNAVNLASTANSTVTKLGDSSSEVGKVVKVITSIAQQTKLLALNATIEAARAGEAGKGFAVVANEVKELAKETAKATEEISQKIEAIQADSRGAVQAIGEIAGIIGQINDIQTTIASAVEEQTATSNEMSRNVNEGAKGAREIASHIGSVAQAARETSSGAMRSMSAASTISEVANDLIKAFQ